MDKTQAKKFLYTTLGIAGAILALAVFIVVKKKVDTKIIAKNTNEVISPEEDKKLDAEIEKALNSIDFENFDTDQDGVPDWQEYIYGLNPASAETYGEGTNDKVFIENIQERMPSGSVYQDLIPSKTDIVAQDLYKASQRISTDSDVAEVGDMFVKNITNLDLSPDIKSSDVVYASDFKESYAEYITQVAPIISNTKAFEITDIFTYQDFTKPETLEKIAEVKNTLNSFTSILEVTKPPKAWLEQHVELRNAIKELNQKLYYIVNQQEDEVSTLAAYSNLQVSAENFVKSNLAMLQLMYSYVQKQ